METHVVSQWHVKAPLTAFLTQVEANKSDGPKECHLEVFKQKPIILAAQVSLWYRLLTTSSCPSREYLFKSRSALSTPSADSNSQNPNPLGEPVVGSCARFQLLIPPHSCISKKDVFENQISSFCKRPYKEIWLFRHHNEGIGRHSCNLRFAKREAYPVHV